MQRRAGEQLKERLTALLAENGFELPKDAVKTFAGPRRLTAVVADLPAAQPDRTVERKGPKVGSPQGAIDGFLKASGLASLDQAEQRDSGKGVFYFAVQKQPGRATAAVVAEIVPTLIKAFDWPKSMRWATWGQRWIRPLHAVLCVFGGETVPGRIDLGGGAMGFTNETVGHRFLAPAPFAVTSFEDYADKLDKAYVMVDAADRKAYISRIAGQRAGDGVSGGMTKGLAGLKAQVGPARESMMFFTSALGDFGPAGRTAQTALTGLGGAFMAATPILGGVAAGMALVRLATGAISSSMGCFVKCSRSR